MILLEWLGAMLLMILLLPIFVVLVILFGIVLAFAWTFQLIAYVFVDRS